jgi:CRP-like cAMP-binding protein
VSRAFEQQLAFRSRMLYERLASDPSMPLEMRLARLLQTLSAMYGVPDADGVLLRMKISQSDLGDWLGVSRQRANAAVQQLRGEGLIQLRYSTITIVDPAKLASCARL